MAVSRIKKQKYERTKLNESQLVLLELLYKYRFATRELIGSYLGINSGISLFERLQVLEKYGYIDKRLDIRVRGIKKSSAYFITAKGLKTLQALPEHEHIDDRALRLTYQNKSTVHDSYVAHTLNVFDFTERLKQHYPKLKVFTQRDMVQYGYFPQKLPDAFLSLASEDPDQPHRFFFDIVRDRAKRSVLDYQLRQYHEFFDEGGWNETESPEPAILLVCEWGQDEPKTQRTVQSLINRLGSEMRVFTTTSHALEKNNTSEAIWSDVQNIEEALSLEEISVNP